MSCRFSIPIKISPDEVYAKATAAIKGAGGTTTATGDNGTFSIPTPIGKIAGDFSIDAGIMNVIITDKPLLISCSAIEQRLKGFINTSV
jgi:hypothetical protein